MRPTVAPIAATLGAVVTGLELARMDTPTWKAVEQAFHDHAVLVFPGQHLTEEDQVAFAHRFGDIEILAPNPEQKAVAISNQKPDGSILGADEHRYKSLRGNEGWHTDSSYMPLSAKASVLSAQVVPSTAGETEWADMRAAYDALDEATRAAYRVALGSPLPLPFPGQDRPRGSARGRVRVPHEGGAAAAAREDSSRHGAPGPVHRPPRP